METERTSLLPPTAESLPAKTQDKTLQGSVLVLIQFDVCEEIRLDDLRDIFGARRQEASFKHAAPGYVRYERPPVVERIEPLVLKTSGCLNGQMFHSDRKAAARKRHSTHHSRNT